MFLYVSFINPGLHYFFEIYLSSIINSTTFKNMEIINVLISTLKDYF